MSTLIDDTGFIGQGLPWPIVLENGRAKLTTGYDLLNSDLTTLITWPLGNRFLLGEFGSRIFDLIEEPNNDALKSLLRTFVQDAVAEWETRLIFVDVQVVFPYYTKALVHYFYKVSDTAPTKSFIIPFYRNKPTQ